MERDFVISVRRLRMSSPAARQHIFQRTHRAGIGRWAKRTPDHELIITGTTLPRQPLVDVVACPKMVKGAAVLKTAAPIKRLPTVRRD